MDNLTAEQEKALFCPTAIPEEEVKSFDDLHELLNRKSCNKFSYQGLDGGNHIFQPIGQQGSKEIYGYWSPHLIRQQMRLGTDFGEIYKKTTMTYALELSSDLVQDLFPFFERQSPPPKVFSEENASFKPTTRGKVNVYALDYDLLPKIMSAFLAEYRQQLLHLIPDARLHHFKTMKGLMSLSPKQETFEKILVGNKFQDVHNICFQYVFSSIAFAKLGFGIDVHFVKASGKLKDVPYFEFKLDDKTWRVPNKGFIARPVVTSYSENNLVVKSQYVAIDDAGNDKKLWTSINILNSIASLLPLDISGMSYKDIAMVPYHKQLVTLLEFKYKQYVEENEDGPPTASPYLHEEIRELDYADVLGLFDDFLIN